MLKKNTGKNISNKQINEGKQNERGGGIEMGKKNNAMITIINEEFRN